MSSINCVFAANSCKVKYSPSFAFARAANKSPVLKMHNDTVRFTNEINSVIDAIEENGLYEIQEQLEANVIAAFQQIAQTSVALGIQIDFEAMVSPSWMADDSNKDELDVEELQHLQHQAETLVES